MTPTQVLQEIRKMRFEEAYEGWSAGRLTQAVLLSRRSLPAQAARTQEIVSLALSVSYM